MKAGVAPKRFLSGTFRGVPVTDAFAAAAVQQEVVVSKLGAIPWPTGLAPVATAFGNYSPGTKITDAVKAKVDALIVMYTDEEISALLDVFTGSNAWSATRAKTWCGYAHNFASFEPDIENIGDDNALKNGMFGYLSAVKIGTKTVALYKSELHPKQNGAHLPFIGVMQQLVSELEPSLVISTGTAGAIGGNVNCGDVAITDRARFHCQTHYPDYPDINTMSAAGTELTSGIAISAEFLQYAAVNFTKLSLPGLAKCYTKLQQLPGYAFVPNSMLAPAIYVAGQNPVPGPQPMDVVSADYLTVDDTQNGEGLQSLGVMNDTDDAFLFYAISRMAGAKPKWLSVRNASEPQIVAVPFPAGITQKQIVQELGGIAGTIYGIYQYCTTLNSAFACWGAVAGM